MPKIAIIDTPFDPLIYLSQHQPITSQTGAQSIFIGYMRDFREENIVNAMTITHYPQMTEKHLAKKAGELTEKYHLLDMLIAHRVGRVDPTAPLVLISSTASHRANAIQATQAMLEILKFTAPFWKQEHSKDGSNWVDGNTTNSLQ